MLCFQNNFYWNTNKSSLLNILFLMMSKINSKNWSWIWVVFSNFLKLNGKLLKKYIWLQNIRIKQNNLYLNFKLSRNNQRSIFLLNTGGLKLIARQEKRNITTCCFNDTFLVKIIMKLYFMFPFKVPQYPDIIDLNPYVPEIKDIQHEKIHFY